MPTSKQIDEAVRQVRDAHTFLSGLLGEALGWPTSDARQVDDIAYGWTQADLNAVGLDDHLVEGSIWQLQPGTTDQPWGIFVLEFKHEGALSPRRGMAGVLRKVLRGLVANQRKKGTLPSWEREHLLFICTFGWAHFKFAYFRSKPDQPGSARLTTFGWDPSTKDKNRTLIEFNLPALAWPHDPKDGEGWTKAWAQAFDKEPLTRDFFKRFNDALALIKADLEKFQKLPSAAAYTNAQLLLERLIFLYFLQNRGWLNQKRDYLTAEFAHHTESEAYSYYQKFLDKLFWTLSTAPDQGGRLPGIPFLNGGLFDDDEFRPQRKISPPLKVRNATMRSVFGDFLEAFNFTVKEDTPLSQEVAVDPEMLGKVFESIVLYAEAADPDAVAPDKRKATGSYYTPRIVVHFICREALYQYLLNHLHEEGWGPRLKELLAFDLTDGFDEPTKVRLRSTIKPEQARQALDLVKELKCCDPAVGSGAFPVGLMHELVNLRRLLETALNGYKDPVINKGSQWLHDTKEHIVENCLFGVDIQQQAIEICRLRLWLSLIVDYDIGPDPFEAERQQFRQAIDRMSQLPNLEMNFRRGDSLHDHVCGVPVVILPDRTVRHFEEFTAISKLGAELHQAKRSEKKKRLRAAILERRLKLSGNLVQEEIERVLRNDSALDGLFGIEESKAKKRDRNEREVESLKKALASIDKDTRELEKLMRHAADNQFYAKLRKLEGADFNSPFNFAWYIDFPNVFAQRSGGFDIVVGNPPFVTARNPRKREMWRKRWPRVSQSTYQLVCPFVELAFQILAPSGQLGYIVSNAFSKRNFGRGLVENFLPTVDLQKIIDCSGLMFPGHGTPTCLLFAQSAVPRSESPIYFTATLSGGGDLRTPPEDSLLWRAIAENHDRPGWTDTRISVSARNRIDMASWPWIFDDKALVTLKQAEQNTVPLSRLLAGYGSMFDTHKDDIFFLDSGLARRLALSNKDLAAFATGDQVRDWRLLPRDLVLRPYTTDWKLRQDTDDPLFLYLRKFRTILGGRATFGGETYDEAGEPWFKYHQMTVAHITAPWCIVYPEIATHGHFVCRVPGTLFTQTAPVVRLRNNTELANHAVAGILNSSPHYS
ncbi:MAG: N-6 DNA methylase [Acidobacteriia bacterium]|nr:N-6 DNA methylase [Terriglobia bacterium]